ncbi:MAG: hypothetical protein U0R49_07415 [Fimbriimonadales bacterium]
MKFKSFIGLTALFGIVSLGLAQQPGPGATAPPTAPEQGKNRLQGNGQKLLTKGAGGSGAMLLLMPAVQTELKMSQEQIAALKEAVPSVGSKKAGAPGAGQKKGPEVMAALEKVKSGLNTEQQKRLGQLLLQFEGPVALMNPQVAEKVGVTPEQKSQIQAMMKEVFSGLKDANLQPKERREKMQAVKKEVGAKILALLSDGQKTQWNSLLGSPFNFPKR